MTREEFLKRLRRGLSGMPAADVDDIVSDHAAYFDAAKDDGRSDQEVALALGDPGRLAREIKLEAGIKRWEEFRSPSSAWKAVIAFLGLGALDILILLPLLASVVSVIFALYLAMLAGFIAGGAVMIVGPFTAFPGGAWAAMLCGVGILALTTAFTALLTMATIGLLNGLLWFGRLHYRVIKPVIEPQA